MVISFSTRSESWQTEYCKNVSIKYRSRFLNYKFSKKITLNLVLKRVLFTCKGLLQKRIDVLSETLYSENAKIDIYRQ